MRNFDSDDWFDLGFKIIIGILILAFILVGVGLVTGKLKPVKIGIHRVSYNGHTYIKNTDEYTSQILHDPDCSCGGK